MLHCLSQLHRATAKKPHEEETSKQKLYVDNDDDDDDEISWNNQPREGTVCQ